MTTIEHDDTKPHVRKLRSPFSYQENPEHLWRVWVPPTGDHCYEPYGDTENGALKAPWGESFWPDYESACEFLREVAAENYTATVPGQFFVHYDNGVVTSMVWSPLESYAGYFGPPTSLHDGGTEDTEISSDVEGPFWRGVQEALGGGMNIEWRE